MGVESLEPKYPNIEEVIKELNTVVKNIIWKDQNNFLDFRKITTDHSVNKDLVSFLMTNLQQGLKYR